MERELEVKVLGMDFDDLKKGLYPLVESLSARKNKSIPS